MRQIDRITIIETLDDIRAGYIGMALVQRGVRPEIINLEHGDALPPVEEVSKMGALAVMGSPYGVHEDLRHIHHINALAREAYHTDTTFFGGCFGLQTGVLGAGGDVVTSVPTEYGLSDENGRFIVTLTPEAYNDPFTKNLPPSFGVLQAHGKMVVPTGRMTTMGMSNGIHQMVRFGRRGFGVQFHNEVMHDEEGEKNVWPNWLKNADGLKQQDPVRLTTEFETAHPEHRVIALQLGYNLHDFIQTTY